MIVPDSRPYRGRFAPSPTGPLHFGSLIAAVGSYLRAHEQSGKWLVRMEDLDPPREVPGAAALILQTLEHYGFEWDGPVVYQSARHHAYQAALNQLESQGDVYPCGCTRKEIAMATQANPHLLPGVYPGTCRQGLAEGQQPRSLRLNTQGSRIEFTDGIQGRIATDFSTIGDFVLKRADGLFAYQLAVVVDDAEARISEIVRGSDLLDSTPRQILLQHRLGLPTPAYLHLPVVNNPQGEKLSKQTHATALPLDGQAGNWLWRALDFLDQSPPHELIHESVEEIWNWAKTHWEIQRIPPILAKQADQPALH